MSDFKTPNSANPSANTNNTRRRAESDPGSKHPTKDTWISPCENREKNIHFFMFLYKCDQCELRRNCPNKVTCRGWHHEGERRRNPKIFSYSEEPCPSVKGSGSTRWLTPSRCNKADSCAFSHTLLEQMYHPYIYKTSLCINFTHPSGNRCQWGYYCTHAHGREDIRTPPRRPATRVNDSNGEKASLSAGVSNGLQNHTNSGSSLGDSVNDSGGNAGAPTNNDGWNKNTGRSPPGNEFEQIDLGPIPSRQRSISNPDIFHRPNNVLTLTNTNSNPSTSASKLQPPMDGPFAPYMWPAADYVPRGYGHPRHSRANSWDGGTPYVKPYQYPPMYSHFDPRPFKKSPKVRAPSPPIDGNNRQMEPDLMPSTAAFDRLITDLEKCNSEIEKLRKCNAFLQQMVSNTQQKKDKIVQQTFGLHEDVQKKITRLEYLVTCPSCKSGDNNRNRVLIPCGHLICDKCIESKCSQGCPICSHEIESNCVV